MEKSSPPLSSDELLQWRWLLGGLLTLMAASSVFYLDVDAWSFMALAVVSSAAATARPGWLALLPAWFHRLAFPVIAAVFVADLWLTGEPLSSMVRLDLLLLAYRSLVFRKRRDDLQGIVLGLFLVIVAGVLTVSIVFVLQIMAFTAIALGLLLTITLTDATGGEKNPTTAITGEAPAWARDVRWRHLLRRMRQTTDWRVMGLGVALFAGLVVLSGALFLAIPRFQLENTFWLDRLAGKKAKTGFSETVRFGDVTEITEDNSVALTVDVSDRTRIPANPYWRMLVLDEYREGTFRLSPALRLRSYSAERTGTQVRGSLTRPEPGAWTFYLEPGVSRHLPLLGAFSRLQFQEAQNHRSSPGLGLVSLRDEPARMTAYRVDGMRTGESWPDRGFKKQLEARGDTDRNAPSLLMNVDVSATDRTTLARVLREAGVTTSGDPPDRAGLILTWLQRRHDYSLRPVVPAGAGDPLVRWLDSSAAGHCELFAGSMVVLARTAGLPARIVTGFRGGTWNAFSNNFTLRNSDAHAWCEIFDVGSGAWLRFDPTPGAGNSGAAEVTGEEALAGRFDRSWSARLDSLRVFWYRRIVNFDQQSQIETLKAVKSVAENTSARLRAWFEGAAGVLRAWLKSPWDGRRAAGTAAAAVIVVTMLWILRKGWRRWRARGGRGGGSADAAVRARAGQWLARVMPMSGLSRDHARLVSDLQRVRFGPRATWGDPEPVFRAARRCWRERATRSSAASAAGGSSS